jgi:hypothetical protein
MSPSPALASLFPFPVPPDYKWSNKYTLMRAGETEKESKNVMESNAMFMTNRVEGNIMTGRGVGQVEESIKVRGKWGGCGEITATVGKRVLF